MHPSPIYNEPVPLPVRREVGQLVIGSLPAASVPPGFRSLVRDFGMGGVTLFRRNIEGPEQVADLSRELRGLGLQVGYHPLESNPYHGEVWGAFNKVQQDGLRNACQWFVEIPGVAIR